MITTQTVKLKKNDNIDNCLIEKELCKSGKNLIRWAIIDITETEIILSVSFLEA